MSRWRSPRTCSTKRTRPIGSRFSTAADLTARFDLPAQVLDGNVRLEQTDGHQWIARIVEAFPGRVAAIRVGKPTLEDVFIDRCGRRFGDEEAKVLEQLA